MDRRKSSRWVRFGPRILQGLALVVFIIINLIIHREKPNISIGYGQLKQLLEVPSIEFKSIEVGKKEIRGEIFFGKELLVVDPKFMPHEAETTEHRAIVRFKTQRVGVENDTQLIPLLEKKTPGIYRGEEEESAVQSFLGVISWIAMMVITLVITVQIMRHVMGTPGGTPFGFGRSRHKVYAQKGNSKVTFADVAGIDEAKTELLEVVDFLKNPEKYTALGGRIPKGVLLVGPPGTGKTLLARSVAGEASVPFFSMSGSDFVEMFVGVGASRVRDLFRDAELYAPCIIFIDELDALGKSRSQNGMTSHEEREQTLNQLLVEMDGFDPNRGVIIMAATNRPEILDAALLRPGRFDRTVVVDRPDIHGRKAILDVHARRIKMGDDIQLDRVAALTPGSVGADLENLVNEAALMAARRGHPAVTMKDFDEAIERGAVGLERKSRIMRPEEKHRVAVHEAGHAIVACTVTGSDPVHKVSIIPRGMAGGYVLQRPDGDRMLLTRGELEARIKVALGGTIAEELALGDISTGAVGDLQKANEIARRMVQEYGMSELGRVYHSSVEGDGFLPGMMGEGARGCSEETSREIDLQIRKIIEDCLIQVRSILSRGKVALQVLSDILIEKEVIDGPDLLELLTKNGIPPDEKVRKNILDQHAIHQHPPVV
jgi:cell division protease FtsH